MSIPVNNFGLSGFAEFELIPPMKKKRTELNPTCSFLAPPPPKYLAHACQRTFVGKGEALAGIKVSGYDKVVS